jgi:hypothetical protein
MVALKPGHRCKATGCIHQPAKVRGPCAVTLLSANGSSPAGDRSISVFLVCEPREPPSASREQAATSVQDIYFLVSRTDSYKLGINLICLVA